MYRKPEVVVVSASIKAIQGHQSVNTKGILTYQDGLPPNLPNQTTPAYEGDE